MQRFRGFPKGQFFNQSTQRFEKIGKRAPLQRQINKIKSKIKKEPAIVVGAQITGTTSATALVVHLDPGAGSTNGVTLDGVRAFIKSVRIKGSFKSAADLASIVRIDVILDRRPTPGTIATAALLYLPLNNTNAHLVPLNKTRFKTLVTIRDYVSNLTNGGMVFDRFIKLNLLVNSLADASFTQANQNKNAILIVISTDATTAQPTFKYSTTSVMVDDN